MGELIQKPDTNPVVVAILNLCLFGGVGYFMMGQQKKGIIATAATIATIPFGVGILLPFISAYDAYLLGQKLQNGEAISEHENGFEFLNAVFQG